MDNETGFKDEMDQYTEDTVINDLEVTKYDNEKLVDIYLKWYTLFSNFGCMEEGFTGRAHTTKPMIKILYCLLTNSVRVKKGSGIDCINLDTNKKIYIKVINKKDDYLYLKKDVIADTMIIFDCIKMYDYKAYQIDLDVMKKILESNGKKIKFYDFMRIYKLKPLLSGDIDDLKHDYKSPKVGVSILECLNKIEKKMDEISILEKQIKDIYKKTFKKD